MTNYEKMMENYEIVSGIRREANEIVHAYMDIIRKDRQQINTNPDLSSVGQAKKIAELKKEYGKKFINSARELKDKYNRAVVAASVAAEIILNEEPPRPSDTKVKTFERTYKDLKMKLLLNNRPEDSINLIKNFADNIDDPYLIKQMLNDFDDLVKTVLSYSDNPIKSKIELRKVYNTLAENSLTDEQKQAQKIYEALQDAHQFSIFSPIEVEAISREMGRIYANYANKPELYLDNDEV